MALMATLFVYVTTYLNRNIGYNSAIAQTLESHSNGMYHTISHSDKIYVYNRKHRALTMGFHNGVKGDRI